MLFHHILLHMGERSWWYSDQTKPRYASQQAKDGWLISFLFEFGGRVWLMIEVLKLPKCNVELQVRLSDKSLWHFEDLSQKGLAKTLLAKRALDHVLMKG